MEEIMKTILVDLDGVLNTYYGLYDSDYIPPMQEGAFEFLKFLSKNFLIKIFTTRNKLLVAKWIIENNLDNYIEDITSIKEPCWLYIDDRCIQFNGNYQELNEKILTYKPWYKQEHSEHEK